MFGLCLLPQGEVGLIALLTHAVEIVAAGIFDVLQTATRENTVLILFVVCLDIEIDGAVALVSKAIVDNLLNQLLLLDDMTSGMGLDRGAQHIQSIHSRMIAVGVVLCYLHWLKLLQTSLLGNLVLTLVGIMLQVAHIGDVAHIAHLVAQLLQVAEQHVEGDGRTGVAQVRVAIDRGAADVHPHLSGFDRYEFFFFLILQNNK